MFSARYIFRIQLLIVCIYMHAHDDDDGGGGRILPFPNPRSFSCNTDITAMAKRISRWSHIPAIPSPPGPTT